MKYYLIGIKGSAMSALAKILLDLGNEVIGVDVEEDYYTFNDLKEKIKCESFTDYKLLEEYFYIIGNAYIESPITNEVIRLNYQYKYYPKFINDFFSLPKIAICGSHGKTSTYGNGKNSVMPMFFRCGTFYF